MTPLPPANEFEDRGAGGQQDGSVSCPEWEEKLVEAARASSRSGTAETAAADSSGVLAHAAVCPGCSQRLAAERAVSAELASLAAADSALGPSSGCEATLLAAFRGERGREVRARRWIFAVAATLTAALLIFVGGALLISRDSGSLVSAVLSRIPGMDAARNASGHGERNAAGAGPAAAVSESEEEVTEFYAFYPGADPASVDSGALVRVRVPSSELGAFGLQVAQGREDEWVNADLLVAEDGSPQAIRFVMPAPQESRN